MHRISKQPSSGNVRNRTRRRGWLSIELVLTLPILMVLLLGLFEFSLLFYARSSVVEASRAGARAASLAGINQQQVEDAVKRILPPALSENCSVDYVPGEKSGDRVTVGVRVPMSSAAPDVLWMVGYSLEDQDLYAETSMIRE